MKYIYLVFTRDFDQWINMMVRDVFNHKLPRLFSKGLSDQITHYTGRTFEWYRYVDEMEELKKSVIQKSLDDYIFQRQTHSEYLKDVAFLRKLISQNPDKISDDPRFYKLLKDTYVKMYPFYILAVFLPGVWKDDFLKTHGPRGKKIIELVFRSREESEGLLKEITNFLRTWIGPKIKSHGYSSGYSKLLSVAEIENLIQKNILPPRKVLIARSRGFVCRNNKITPIGDFSKCLKGRGLNIKSDSLPFSGELRGSVAYNGKVLKGKVKIILNADEVGGFKRNMILVTTMTAPEYLPIMKQARAIVTDEGGITCHAAIVAREMKKPCIIGTKIATKVFKDGDLVEVDANKGIVRKV